MNGEELDEKPECNISLDEPVICVLNKQKKYGILKFIGKTKFSPGVWCGIALNEPCGKNDGSVAGIKYFMCDDYHGIFVNPKSVYPANPECETISLGINKPVKRRVLPNLIQESSAHQTHELQHGTVDKVCCDEALVNPDEDLEGRPRSKSDNALTNERNEILNFFSNSPFKCDLRAGKSSSLSKLNNATYLCSSPITAGHIESELDSRCLETASSALLTSHGEVHKIDENLTSTQSSHQDSANEGSLAASPVHHHVHLSPQFEVKQSIKLGSIASARFPALLISVKGQESGLNKTFLIRKELTPHVESKVDVNQREEKATVESKVNESNEKSQKQNTISKLQQSSKNENLNSSFVSINESDCDTVEVRSRSVSKSSWSSVESLSSVGSSNKERSRLKSNEMSKELSRKLPCTSDTAKSKLVKISAESKIKSKRSTKEESNTSHGIAVSKTLGDKSTANEKTSTNKSRTKSTSVVSGRSRLVPDTPSSSKSTVRSKSKSVSSDCRERIPLTKSRVSTAKVSTLTVTKTLGTITPRRSVSTSQVTTSEKKSKVGSTSKTSSVSTLASNHVKQPRSLPQESKKSDVKVSARQVKNKVLDSDKHKAKQDENKLTATKTRNMSTSAAENGGSKSSGVKSSVTKSSISRANENHLLSGKTLSRKVQEKSSERSFLKKKTPSQDSIKKKFAKEKADSTDHVSASCLSSALTPDILKQTPEVTRQSVGIQVDTLEHDRYVQLLTDQYNDEQEKVQSLASVLSTRNRDLEAVLIALQVYSQKVDDEYEKAKRLRKSMKFTKEKCSYAEKKIAKESSYRARLEDEVLSVKSDSVVEVALLKAEYERKQELIQTKLLDDHKLDLENVRKQNNNAIQELKRGCELKMKRVEETYVQDITEINKNHKDIITELEMQHSKAVDELIEERLVEIETIKADYEEQMEQFQERLSESGRKCNTLIEQLRIADEGSKKYIELRNQDAIAKYKTLPDELESMKFVLELKNKEVKKLRLCNVQLQNQIDELQRVKNRAALLEREKESLHFVVENKAQFERQLSLERDKLRLSLDREVAASKRLSLENEELSWRLNTFQNSPTSPTFDRINWNRMSGFSSPDSAVYSQRIEESDLESQMYDTKETSN